MYGEMTPIGMYTLNRQIPLCRCKVTELDPFDPDFKIAFILESPAKSFKIKARFVPSFTLVLFFLQLLSLFVRDENEKKEWLDVIRDAVEKQKTLSSFDKDLVAPVW